jgi:hypothetical protein
VLTLDALMFLAEVMAPVFGQIVVGDEGAELEDGFGSGKAPAGAGDIETPAPTSSSQPRSTSLWTISY